MYIGVAPQLVLYGRGMLSMGDETRCGVSEARLQDNSLLGDSSWTSDVELNVKRRLTRNFEYWSLERFFLPLLYKIARFMIHMDEERLGG